MGGIARRCGQQRDARLSGFATVSDGDGMNWWGFGLGNSFGLPEVIGPAETMIGKPWGLCAR